MAVENWPVGWFFCKLLGERSLVDQDLAAPAQHAGEIERFAAEFDRLDLLRPAGAVEFALQRECVGSSLPRASQGEQAS
jgi:hypothetical protein